MSECLKPADAHEQNTDGVVQRLSQVACGSAQEGVVLQDFSAAGAISRDTEGVDVGFACTPSTIEG